MKQVPVYKNKILITRRVKFSITILILLLTCGCGSLVTADDYVRIQADPVSGDPPLTVLFSADVQSSIGDPDRYVWSLGDGARETTSSFSHTYTEEGTYRVNLMVQFEDGTFGRADVVRITVGNPVATPVPTSTPRSTPTPTLTPTPTQTQTLTLTLTPTQSPTQTPPSTQEATPAPTTAPAGASASSSFAGPVGFSNNNPTYPVAVTLSSVQGAKPHIVAFSIQGAGTKEIRPLSYSWNFGDAARGGGSEPRHIYSNSGTYAPVVVVRFDDDHEEILLLPHITILDQPIVVEGEEGAAVQTPAQTPAPVAVQTVANPSTRQKIDEYSVKIVPSRTSGPGPLYVRFTSETEGGVPLVWKWDFGDGFKNTIEKPSYTYNKPGTYEVQLSVQFYGALWIDAEPIIITVG